MKKWISRILATLMIWQPFATTVSAAPMGEEEMFFTDLPSVIVASGKQEAVKDAPAHVYSITGEEMLNRGYRTLIDLLPDLPSTNVAELVSDPSDYPQPQGATNTRGVQGGLKLLIDGVEMDPQHGYSNTWGQNIPITGVDRVEFIVGPYPSLYGRNTFSGVINVVLKAGEKVNGVQLSGMYGSYPQFQGTALFGKKYGGWDLYGSVFGNRSSQGRNLVKEYPDVYGMKVRPTPFRQGVPERYSESWNHEDYYFRMKHDKGTEVNLQYNRLVEPNINSRFNPNTYVADRFATDRKPTFNARIKQAYNLGPVQAETAVKFQKWERKGRNQYINPNGSNLSVPPAANPAGIGPAVKTILARSQTIGIRQDFRYKVKESNETLFKVGYDAVSEPMKKDRYVRAPDLEDPRSRVFLNLSLQHETRWTEAFKTVVGMMHERGNVGAPVWLPRASVVYNATLHDTVKVLYGKGYRTPGTELLTDQATPTGIGKGAASLDPTWIESFDTQWIRQASERLRTSVSAFYNTQKNFTKRRAVSPAPTPSPTAIVSNIVNVPDGRKRAYGAELEVSASITDVLKSFLSYSFIDGKENTEDASGNRITQGGVLFTAKHQVKTGVNFLLVKKCLNLYLHNIYRSSSGNWFNTARLGAYNTFDVNVRTTDELSARWYVSAGVKNALNRGGFIASPDGSISAFIPSAIRKRYWTVESGIKF